MTKSMVPEHPAVRLVKVRLGEHLRKLNLPLAPAAAEDGGIAVGNLAHGLSVLHQNHGLQVVIVLSQFICSLDGLRQLRAAADPKLHLFHIICNGLQIYFCIHPIVLIHFFISSIICHSVILCCLLFPSASFRHSLIPPIRSSASRE